jgi:fumarate reductase subunit D
MSIDRTNNGGTLLAAISYLGILCIIPFIIGSRNDFTMFHARQGMVLFIWEFVALSLMIIPILGQIAFFISSIICFVFSIMGIYNALMGNYWKVPFFSRFSGEIA